MSLLPPDLPLDVLKVLVVPRMSAIRTKLLLFVIIRAHGAQQKLLSFRKGKSFRQTPSVTSKGKILLVATAANLAKAIDESSSKKGKVPMKVQSLSVWVMGDSV